MPLIARTATLDPRTDPPPSHTTSTTADSGAPPRPRSAARLIHSPAVRSALITLCVILAVTGLEWAAWRQYRSSERQRAADAFEHSVDQAARSLEQQLAQYRNALFGLRAVHIASHEVDSIEFRRYVQALDIANNLPGLRAFAFNRELAGTEREAYVARLRQTLSTHDPLYADFDITPAGTRERHHVVELVEPMAGNDAALGLDVLPNAAGREALERARLTGFAASSPIPLRRGQDMRPAILIFSPLTEGNDSVAASFLLDDLIKAAIAPRLRERFHLRLDDLGAVDETTSAARPLFSDPAPGSDPTADPRALVREIVFGGRHWRLVFTPRQPPATTDEYGLLLLALLLGGALMAGALSHLLQQRGRRVARDRALARLAADCVLELDADGVVRKIDATAERLTGRAVEHWSGRPLQDNILPHHSTPVAPAVDRCVRSGEPIELECRALSDHGEARWIAIRLGNHLQHPQIGAVLAQVADIDDRKNAEARVARLAFFDPLTQLPNRRLLEQRAELTFNSARRHHDNAAVVVLDLDGFKEINDSAGHAVGDEVLASVAARLLRAVRDSDTVARLGGDEFVILLGAPAGVAEVEAAADRLLHALAAPIVVAGRNWLISASLGMALYPVHGTDFATLLAAADAAMYSSKRSGNGRSTLVAVPA